MSYKEEKSYWLQDMNKICYIKGLICGLLLILAVAYLFYGSFFMAILLSPYLIYHMKSWTKKQVLKVQKEFKLQFKEAIQAISASLHVGYSAENSMKEAMIDLQLVYPKDARILKEFNFMLRQLEMNLSLEQILREFGKRTGDEEVQLFATVFGLSKRAGGDMIEIIRNTVWQIGEKIEVKQEIDTAMAAKKMEFRVMSMVPLGMIGYIKLAFPSFMDVVYGNVVGVVFMSICLVVYAAAYEWGRRMIEIEV